MTVLCPGCRRAIRVPADRETTPNLRARCAGCGQVFAVADADRVAAPPPAAPRTPQTTRPPAPPLPDAPPSIPPAARPARAGRPAVGWRRCANHRSTPSEGVCTQCGKGFCGECVKRQGTAAICPNCDALCTSAAEQEQQEERARMRARPLTAELGTVLAYPFTDKVAYVALAVFVGVFAPIALVAAAISRSFLATLNPLAGLDAIRKMGGVYWTAMAVYTAIVVGAALFGGILSLIPIGGRLLKAIVDSYAHLAIGCLLGFAVFKKARELNLD